MQLTPNISFTNEDCMELMARYPDNYFDLAIVDPPYGRGDALVLGGATSKRKSSIFHNNKDAVIWDIRPNPIFFKELFRTSKNQIIWGGNYFIEHLYNTQCCISWDKIQEFTGSDFELAWTSFEKASKTFRMSRVEAYSSGKIHPTQKPVKLYEWLLDNYAKEGDKILDTHAGSFSIGIACHYRGFELTACELDKEYYDAAVKRFKEQTSQVKMF